MKHVLLEVYCDLKVSCKKPAFCKGVGHVCVQNKCEHMGCTYCPNEIALTSEYGIVETFDDCIAFGGEMESKKGNLENVLINEWKRICKKKIIEAYDEYMDLE